MIETPLVLPTIVVLGVVALEWRTARVVAYFALVASFVLLVAVMRHPGQSAEAIVAYADTALAVPLTLARTVGAACFLFCVVRQLRARDVPW